MRRRCLTPLLCLATLAAAPAKPARHAALPPLTIALDLALSGPGADENIRARNGALLAIAEANDAGGIGGHGIAVAHDPDTTDATSAADAARVAHALAADASVLAIIGPDRSALAQPMLPIINEAGLAMISPAAAAAALTAVATAAINRPTGRLTFFRLVAPDSFQGIGLADYWATARNLKTAYILDDGSAYGTRLANAFAQRATRQGMQILGHETVNRANLADPSFTAALQKSAAQAIFFGGTDQVGLPLMQQLYAAMPNAIKGGGDGLYGPEVLTAVGFPAAAGWVIATGTPHLLASAATAPFIAAYQKRFGQMPDDFAMTGYDAADIVLAAIRTIIGAGDVPTRETIRSTIAEQTVDTVQGRIGFDPNGDLRVKPVSLFVLRAAPGAPADDMDADFAYLGPAPLD